MARAFPALSSRVETERLVLRLVRTSDVAELRRVMRKNAQHLRPWSPATRPGEDPASLTEVSKMIVRQRHDWKRGAAFIFVSVLRALGEPIVGRISLNAVVRGVFQNAYLGYWVDVDHQSQGLTTEALSGALRFAFDIAGLHRVQAAIMPKNAPSLRVIEKAGFRREGLAERYLQIAGNWEDHLLFAITAEEFDRRR